MDYTQYRVEDFASNESFIHWVHQSDPEAVIFWNTYIETHPQIKFQVEKARILVLNLKQAEHTKDEQERIDSIWNKLQLRIDSDFTTPQIPATKKLPAKKISMALAGVLVLGICLTVWFFQPMTHHSDAYVFQKKMPGYLQKVNQTGKPLKIQLADGSVITLENKSYLKYKSDYSKDSTREVYLLGSAFFEVAENPYKPFIVHANEVFTKVLGTSFRIEAPENGKDIVVSVKTGKVSVYTLKTPALPTATRQGDAVASQTAGSFIREGVILLPNQCVSYKRDNQSFDKRLVDSPVLLTPAITKADFVFDNVPVAQVFKTLEVAYGIEILFNKELTKKCFFTAPLGSEPLLEKIKIICQAIGASYEVIDAKVIITSPGCP